jgi:O-antigen/teichoic acid export membrane protein
MNDLCRPLRDLRTEIYGRFMSLAERIVRWSRLFLEFALNQGLVQAAGMISGLIYVRFMSVEQFAFYAIGLSSLSFLSVGSDMGLTGSLTYFWREGSIHAREQTIAAVRRLRSVFLVIASIICGWLLLKSAAKQNLSILEVLSCLLLVIATASSRLRVTVDILLMRLEGMQRQSYYCEAAGSVTRLLAAIAMIVTGINTALFGLAGGLLGSISIVVALRHFMRKRPTKPRHIYIQSKTWRDVLGCIVPILPTTIVYLVQDPLLYWLALTFGGQAAVSETFAVGRIAAIYALLGNFVLAVVVPRLARISSDAHFIHMAGLFLLVLVALCVMTTTVAYLFPSALLIVIGPKYAHLDTEVVLSITAASFNVLLSFLVLTNRVRGWVRLEPLVAGFQTVAISVLASHWSFRDSASVLELMAVLAGLSCVWFFLIGIVGVLWPAVVKLKPIA